MNQSVESRVVQKYRDRLAQGHLDGVSVISRVDGGMPSKGRMDEEFYVSGRNRARVRARSTGAPLVEAASDLSPAEVRALFDKIGKGVDRLVPRAEAGFLPDSIVGSITIDVDGEQATFFYLVNEEDRADQNKPVEPEMSDALKDMLSMSKKLLDAKED